MKTGLFVVAACLAFSGSMQAVTSYNFNFTVAPSSTTGGGAVGDTMRYYDTNGSGVYVTLSAFSAAGTNGSGALSQSYTGEYSGAGQGICTAAELAASGGCSSPTHQVDNQVQAEFLLMTFSANVSLTNIKLAQFATCSGCAVDMDMSYWTSATSLSTLSTASALGTVNSDLCGGSGQPACTTGGLIDGLSGTNLATNNGQNVRSLVISAGLFGGSDTNFDFFKVQSLTAGAPVTITGTPEPASFVLIGSGLLAGAVFGRRRMNKKSEEQN